MGYSTENTAWPEIEVPAPTKALLDLFFRTLDDKSPSAGEILATKVFTATAEAQFGHGIVRGEKDIADSRQNAWKVVVNRRHVIKNVFVNSTKADDLLCIANVAIEFHNGKNVAGDFACRFQVVNAQNLSPRLHAYHHWSDPTPVKQALQSE